MYTVAVRHIVLLIVTLGVLGGCQSTHDGVPGPGSAIGASKGAAHVAGQQQGAPGARATAGATQGVPQRVVQGPDLTKLREPGLTPQQLLERCLSYLAQIEKEPPTPVMGLGGGPVDASYQNAQIVHEMGRKVPITALRAAREGVAGDLRREQLAVALCIAGDATAVPEVERILASHPDGNLRGKAAMALGDLGGPAVIPSLKAALKDPFVNVTSGGGVGNQQPAKEYPVREEAAESLRLLGVEVPDSVWRRPVRARDAAELVSYLLEDKDPQSCASAVVILGGLGEKGRPYLQRFIDGNANDKTLEDSVKTAQGILAKTPQQDK